MRPVPVRDAEPADVGAIAMLIRALADYEDMADEAVLTEADLARWLFGEAPAAHVTIATTAGGVVAGIALWWVTFSSFAGRPGIWLEDLFVMPEHRGQGHGRALLDALRRRTDARIEWSVLDWNEPSIRFYERLGARPVSGWARYRWTP